MEFKIENITPEQAKIMLRANQQNRNLNMKTVEFYSNQMKAGTWDLTAQPITFFEDGRLGDGQHRLNAVIKANIPVPFLVVYDAPISGNYDNGMKRSIVDSIKMATGKNFRKEAVAVANLVLTYKKKEAEKSLNPKISNEDVYNWLTKNNEKLEDIIKICISKARHSRVNLRNAPFILSIYGFYLNHVEDPCILDVIKDYIEIFKDGFPNDNRKSGTKAVIKIRNAILTRWTDYKLDANKINSTAGRYIKVALFMQAIKLFYEDKSGGRSNHIAYTEKFEYPIEI